MDLRDIFGYYNNKTYDEMQRVFNQNILDYASHFMDFVKLESTNVTDVKLKII